MTDEQFDPETVAALAAVDEVTIETRDAAGEVHRAVIWVMVDGTDVYLRSVRGAAGRWYRELMARGEAVLEADGRRIAVRHVPAADATSIAARCRGGAAPHQRAGESARWRGPGVGSAQVGPGMGTSRRVEPMDEPRDTSPAARAAQLAAFRAMSPADRVRLAVEMTESARQVAAHGAAQRETDLRRGPPKGKARREQAPGSGA